MSLRLYLDEDSMDKTLVEALRARRVDLQTALEAVMIERPDEEHLDYATKQVRVLYSFNVSDYYRLHSSYIWHRGKLIEVSSLPGRNTTRSENRCDVS